MHSVRPQLESLELGDPLIDSRGLLARQARPVAAGGRPVGRELGELLADLLEAQSHPLGEDDERDSPQHGSPIATVGRDGALGGDQAALLVEAQRLGGDAASPRDLGDREQLGHLRRDHMSRLASSSLELVVCTHTKRVRPKRSPG
jgi:hypothetical protein